MGKRAFIAVIIIVVSLLFGMQNFEIARANPFFMYKVVDPPLGIIPLNVTVSSPKNNTVCSSNNVSFSFIVNNAITPTTMPIGICEVNYTLQNQQKRLYVFPNWTQSNIADLTHPGLQQFNYSDTLSLKNCNYTLLIYSSAMGFPGGSTPTLFNINNSATIYFSVKTSISPTLTLSPSSSPSPTNSPSPTQQPTIEPSPTPNNTQENFTPILIIVGIVVVIVAVAGALFYFRKRRG